MPRFHGHRARFGHPRGFPFQGAIWMIGIGVLMLLGQFWPGIIVLIGLSMIMGAFWKESTPSQTFESMASPTIPPAPMTAEPPVMRTPVVPPAPVSIVHRADLLPANCLHCGGPVRANEVKWSGPQAAACSYCGSTLPMKKS